jgi:hypothetical protein
MKVAEQLALTFTLFIAIIPQEDEYKASFNVLVPLSIQGKPCKVLTPAQSPTAYRGSINPTVEVEGKRYQVPTWAIKSIA